MTVSIGTFSNGSVSYEAYDEENDEYETTDNVTSKVLPKGCTLYVYGEDEDYYGDIDVYDGDDFIGYFTVEADDGYSFAGWGTVPETLTGNVTITPTFEADEEEEVTTGSVTINGKEYPTVVINGKEWMAENLAIPSSLSIYYEGVGNHWVEDDGYTMVNEADWETTDGSTPLITQFHNKAIADKFGYMYNYGSILAEFGEAARLYPGIDFGFGTVTDIKSMIPEGWRLPNEDDFKALLGENSASEIVDLDTALLKESDDYSWHCDADGSKLFNAVPSSYVTRKVWVDGRSKLANPFVENNALYVGSNVSDLVLLGAAKKVAVSDMPSQMTSAGVTDDIVITAARFMSTNESEDDVHAQAIVYTGTVFGCTPTDSNLYVNDKLPLTSDKVNVMLHAAVRLVRDAQ